uniref:Copia protein n=1 Tax=Tanacetum cinerariifolium TaxID=118510 RepID=A0A6L2P087_TANCI|nr:copia protein [Tanacetum cinerariifolium]
MDLGIGGSVGRNVQLSGSAFEFQSGFARFNTIITSLKSLGEGFSSKNYVRKFLKALHPKCRAKVMAIEESKNLSLLALDELIGNLKVHEVVMEQDLKIHRGKKKRVKSIDLNAKKESSDDETSTSRSDDEEYDIVVKNFKKFFRRKGKFVRQPREENKSFRQRDEKKGKSDQKCFRCGDPNHLIGDCPKPSRNKDQKAFIGGSWSDSENDAEDKTNNETHLMAQSSNEVTLISSYYSDDASSLDNDSLGFDDSKASTSGTKNMSFVGSSTEKATDGSTIKVHGSTLPGSESPTYGEKGTEQFFCPPKSSRSDFVITRKKLMHNSIDESTKPSLNPSPKSDIDEIFFNQSKYIKETLKKFGLEDSKPTKTPMSTKIKLTKDDEVDSVDSSKYRGTEIETIVYANPDQASDYVDRKSTSSVCTFMGCCLTSWFAKKQTALAISTTEAEYVSVEKACQQALWMKQALIDYGIRLDDVPIVCDNKGAIDLMTMKDLSGIIPETIHHKVDKGGYRKDITVGAALILANVSPKPSMHYLNISKRNVVKVFRKDTVPESVGG